MKKYLFEEYSDKAAIGTERLFNRKEDALNYADREWEGLTKADKARKDMFFIIEIEITEEQLEDYKEGYGIPLTEFWVADVKDYLL